MAFLVKNLLLQRLNLIQLLLLLVYSPSTRAVFGLHELCSDETVHLSQLEDTIWEHIEVKEIRSSSPSSNNKPVGNLIETHKYLFSPCIPLSNHGAWSKYNHSECANANVCFIRTSSNGSVVAEGFGPNGTASSVSNMYQLYLDGNSCEFLPNMKKKVAIRFTCDKFHGLGKPIKDNSYGCTTGNFNWPTIAACSEGNIHRPHLSKCYVYDDHGNERDLSPLIHATGYEVVAASHSQTKFAQLATHLDKRSLNDPETKSNSGFFINVCSEVKNHCSTSTNTDATGPMACYRNNTKVLPLADVRATTIEYDGVSDEVVLKAKSPVGNNSECPNGISTITRFKCPHKSTSETVDSYGALGSRKPFVIATSNCEVIIEWETDYACPTHKIQGNYQSCIIKDEFTKRQIDLSPLKNLGFQTLANLTINYNDAFGHPHDAVDEIVFKVCGQFNMTEPVHSSHCSPSEWNGSSVCLSSSSVSENKTYLNVIGSMTDAKFTFADGLVSLRYPTRKGHCVSPHVAAGTNDLDSPATVIYFPCNETAGLGSPSFVDFDNCIYHIVWPTNLTCYQQNLSYSYRLTTQCTVTHDGSLYDLSLLRKRHDESSWQASVANSVLTKDQSLGEKLIMLNVCSKVTKLSKLAKNITSNSLPENAAVILHSKEGSKSLGRDISPPQWDDKSNSLVLRYVENVNRKNGQGVMIRSTIRFECAPGKVDSSPQLVGVAKDGKSENYDFFWPTAAACPIKEHFGSDCQVLVPSLSSVLDLNPLANEEMFAHTTQSGKYMYYVNVCDNLSSSPCIDKEGGKFAGVCQVDTTNNKSWVLGQANKNLSYWNGILTLRYNDGDKYNNPERTPRSAELSFVCSDEDSLEMIMETNRTYFFRFYTKHACPSVRNMVPCLWSNGTHNVDLGRISIEDDGNHFAIKSTMENAAVAYINICRPLNRFHPDYLNCRHGSAACKIIFGKDNGSYSLGIPKYPPVVIDDQLALIYSNGDPCLTNTSIKYSSKILFFCDPTALQPEVKLATTAKDGCTEVFHVTTNETCEVFPNAKLPSKNTSSEEKSPSSQASNTPQDVSSVPQILFWVFLFLFTMVTVSTLLVLAIHPRSRTAVSTRIRTWACGKIASSNPIHYSQVPTDSRSQLVPLKELTNELNGDRFVPLSSSDSPYNPTTAPFNVEVDQIASNCISYSLHGSSKMKYSTSPNSSSRSILYKMPLNENISITPMSQDENESTVDLLK